MKEKHSKEPRWTENAYDPTQLSFKQINLVHISPADEKEKLLKMILL